MKVFLPREVQYTHLSGPEENNVHLRTVKVVRILWLSAMKTVITEPIVSLSLQVLSHWWVKSFGITQSKIMQVLSHQERIDGHSFQ